VDAPHQVPDLGQRGLGLLVGVGHQLATALGVLVELVAGLAEPHGQGHQPLLGTVVEIALDAAALGLGAVDRRRPARLQPRDLLAQLVLRTGRQQLAGHDHVELGQPDGRPGGGDRQAERPDDAHRRRAGALGDVEQPEVGGVVGQDADVGRQQQERRRPAPGHGGAHGGEDAERQGQQVVHDLTPPGPRPDPLDQPPPPRPGGQRRDRIGEVDAEQRPEPGPLHPPQDERGGEQQPDDRDRQREGDEQAQRRGQQGDDDRERDGAHDHVEHHVGQRPPGGGLAPRPQQISQHAANGKDYRPPGPWSSRESARWGCPYPRVLG
jgi:hypothetical protein